MKQAAGFRKAVLKPGFIALQKELQPAAGPEGPQEIPGDAIQKGSKQGDKNQKEECGDELRTWHGPRPTCFEIGESFFSLRDMEEEACEASAAGCENATPGGR